MRVCTKTGRRTECQFDQQTSKHDVVLKWARWDLNPEPRDYESPALTIELQALNQLRPDNL